MAKNRNYTISQQYTDLLATYKGSWGNLGSNSFEWLFDVRPHPLSCKYRIRIFYQQSKMPKVFVVSPKPLPMADGAKRYPHSFDDKRQQICTFDTRKYEWSSSMLISNTIVHWSIQWLLFYECWVATGKWKGGGHGNYDIIEGYQDEIDHFPKDDNASID